MHQHRLAERGCVCSLSGQFHFLYHIPLYILLTFFAQAKGRPSLRATQPPIDTKVQESELEKYQAGDTDTASGSEVPNDACNAMDDSSDGLFRVSFSVEHHDGGQNTHANVQDDHAKARSSGT